MLEAQSSSPTLGTKAAGLPGPRHLLSARGRRQQGQTQSPSEKSWGRSKQPPGVSTDSKAPPKKGAHTACGTPGKAWHAVYGEAQLSELKKLLR